MNWPTSASRLASVSLFAVGLLGLTTACEKATDLGLDLPGTSPISATFLDLPLKASTVRQQPVQTVKADQYLAGRLKDSFVGTTTATSFLNLLVLSNPDSLPARFTTPVLDSVVLTLPFSQVYGSAAQPLRLDLLPLQQPLDERTVYTSESSVATDPALVSNFAAALNRERTVRTVVSTVSGVNDTINTTAPDQVVRIRLQQYPSAAGPTAALFQALKSTSFNQAALDAVLPGIALRPTATHTGNIVGFSRTSAAQLRFYFQGTTAAGVKKNNLSYALYLASIPPQAGSFADGKYFTQLTTDLSGSALAGLTPQNPLPAASTNGLTYVQEGVGLGTRIEFEGLEALRDQAGLAINRAELLIPVKPFSNALFPYNGGLYLYEVNDANQPLVRTAGASTAERLVQQEGIISTSAGSYRSTPTSVGAPAAATLVGSGTSNQYYAVAITEYLQAYLQNRLNGELPTGLLLSPILRSSTSLTLNRAQLDASGFKLRVYYSKLR
ncbi:DUF4270 domain-containing protein [Hymenobacter sp. NST-14]|uniref:DUF4270 family protein n=1 Tax=Hymenobacter piscis TaxID=2839984 RepID=UPI001C009D94|nr:DUF4270 family protein [Hymenobacter piscis]MBT9392263.1 DUF4270 domain-containing protein [Hymenobacter piscis]